MNKKVIEHKHTIDKKIYILLVLIVVGVFAKEFGSIIAPDLMAELDHGSRLNISHSGSILVK